MAVSIHIKLEPGNVADAFKNPEIREFIQREVLWKLALGIERFAKQVTPVDTGRLRSSIGTSMKLQELGAIVQTNVNYALFVHEGTRRMRPRPFMEWGAKFAVQWWNGDIGSRLDEHLRRKLSSL